MMKQEELKHEEILKKLEAMEAQMPDELKISQEDMETFAKEHLDAYRNEVKVLESIVNANAYVVLPMSVHNLCVISPLESHKFFEITRDLIKSIDLRNKRFDSIKDGVKLTITNLDRLIREEKVAFKNQADNLVIMARKKGISYNLKEESKYFEHVCYDPSVMLQEFFNLTIGGMVLDAHQHELIDKLNGIVHEIAEPLLELRKKAVYNCEILAK